MTWRHLLRTTRAALVAASLTLLAACGGSDGSDAMAAEPEPAAAPAEAPKAEPAKADPHAGHDHAKRSERPLPAFSGYTLDDERLAIGSLIGKRLVIFFFNPEVKDAEVVAQAMRRISKQRADHNFEIVGVATASNRETARSCARRFEIDYRVIDDSSATIARRLGMRYPVALLGVDAEGYVMWGMGQFSTDGPEPDRRIEQQIRTSLRLSDEAAPSGSDRPEAPLFEATILDSDETFVLKDQRGQAVVLVFFLHTCPHCHEFLAFMKEQLEAMPEDARPVLAGVEVTGRTYQVREAMRELDLDFFPVLFDDDGSIRNAYGVFAGVPDTYLIDREGRIAAHLQGWRPEIDGPLMRMRMAKAAGAPVPMLLSAQGYSGNDVCGVCHESEQETWLLTQHASAYDTLVKHGEDSNAECVSCHVVGFGETGGFDLATRPAALEDVGCESCHGRGGPHLSPGFVKDDHYESACVVCHDTKHSLGFEYASFVPRISHAANEAILALPEAERKRILAERGAVRKDLLPTSAAYVGSETCVGCHEAEAATWAKNPHARAMQTLVAQDEHGNAECQACHTTAFGKPGGFDPALPHTEQADLARVGCESCHGPGGNHVAEGATKLGSIVSLGDKCDSCVILQICGGCHDDANDPGFEFAVQDKIDKIRHATIEAGTGKPLKGESAFHAPDAPHAADTDALLAQAFAAAAEATP
ncbi:MAG: multiheme c-type cytochrome [Myxococcota bacterium]